MLKLLFPLQPSPSLSSTPPVRVNDTDALNEEEGGENDDYIDFDDISGKGRVCMWVGGCCCIHGQGHVPSLAHGWGCWLCLHALSRCPGCSVRTLLMLCCPCFPVLMQRFRPLLLTPPAPHTQLRRSMRTGAFPRALWHACQLQQPSRASFATAATPASLCSPLPAPWVPACTACPFISFPSVRLPPHRAAAFRPCRACKQAGWLPQAAARVQLFPSPLRAPCPCLYLALAPLSLVTNRTQRTLGHGKGKRGMMGSVRMREGVPKRWSKHPAPGVRAKLAATKGCSNMQE